MMADINQTIEKLQILWNAYKTLNVIPVETWVIEDALELLKAQEQEIQQLKATHISASGNAIACGVIRGGVTINQKAKEITNIKHVETFNG